MKELARALDKAAQAEFDKASAELEVARSEVQLREVELDIADAAMAPMSGGTSQVNLNTLVDFRFNKVYRGGDGDSGGQVGTPGRGDWRGNPDPDVFSVHGRWPFK